jgi:hypothetical protein
MPIWNVENRLPSFISDEVPLTFGEEFQRMRNEEFSVGCSLYVSFAFFLPKFRIIYVDGETHLRWM